MTMLEVQLAFHHFVIDSINVYILPFLFYQNLRTTFFRPEYPACFYTNPCMEGKSTDRPWHLTLVGVGMTESKREA